MWTTYQAADRDSWLRRPSLPTASGLRDRLPLGVRPDGAVESWRVREQANLLVVGPGRSTTTMLTGLAIEASRRGWRVRICHPHFGDLAGLHGWPNVEAVAASPVAHQAVIAITHAQLGRRQALLESGETTLDELVPVLMVLDRIGDLLRRWSAGPAPRTGYHAAQRLDELASDGPAVGIHLVYADASEPAEHSLRSSFETRLWLGTPAGSAALDVDDEDPTDDEPIELRPYRQALPVAGGLDDGALAAFRPVGEAYGPEPQGAR